MALITVEMADKRIHAFITQVDGLKSFLIFSFSKATTLQIFLM